MTDKKHESAPRVIDRRAFLKAATLGAAAGAGAAVLGTGAEPVEAASTPATDDPGRSRYRETAHVRRAYELARF